MHKKLIAAGIYSRITGHRLIQAEILINFSIELCCYNEFEWQITINIWLLAKHLPMNNDVTYFVAT